MWNPVLIYMYCNQCSPVSIYKDVLWMLQVHNSSLDVVFCVFETNTKWTTLFLDSAKQNDIPDICYINICFSEPKINNILY